MDPVEEAKKLAAYAAVDAHVRKEHRVIGIGSGSTVPFVVERIGAQGKGVNEGRVFLPTESSAGSIDMDLFARPNRAAMVDSLAESAERCTVPAAFCLC
ncbi:hypothetical protein QFC21_006680 [Naganishia friedmannii]|uniref:Uncharacterized protein n=1 Tax=Naganishia friedmannii TaxID=89922 RepID=A0ACC2V1B7_9TREE|nr:hypothetical protein QFC21_006680 [Naganishia friedmannii]